LKWGLAARTATTAMLATASRVKSIIVVRLIFFAFLLAAWLRT